MNALWTYMDTKPWREESKYRITLLILSIVSALAGLLLWLLVSRWALASVTWMICFMGYPVILSWFVVFFYSGRHDFHNGSH